MDKHSSERPCEADLRGTEGTLFVPVEEPAGHALPQGGRRKARHVALVAVALAIGWFEYVLWTRSILLLLSQVNAPPDREQWLYPGATLIVSGLAGALVLLEGSRLWDDIPRVVVTAMRVCAFVIVIGIAGFWVLLLSAGG